MPFQRVAIIGLGLIGSSLGLALRRASKPPRVVGYDRSSDARRQAARKLAVDTVVPEATEAVDGADLVILATPVRTIAPLLAELVPHLAEGCVVTDTGSTKGDVVAAARSVAPQVAFVGGHPMAGRLTRGAEGPDGSLFENTVYCLTPTAVTPPEAVARVVELAEMVGARPYFLEPAEHDGLVAAVSHLPYLLASTLVSALCDTPGWREMGALAAGGFATATRLVDAEPEMYADICHTNQAAILHHLDQFAAQLAALRAAIAEGDPALQERFEHAQAAHETWVQSRESPPSDMPSIQELKGPSLFFPQSWQDALRGKRPERPER